MKHTKKRAAGSRNKIPPQISMQYRKKRGGSYHVKVFYRQSKKRKEG